ncbi:MAG: V-type ATP synthase subunit I [Eubacterium sp.]|nr:V-type ATP synthase subunit I [Eubacterium sp.]
MNKLELISSLENSKSIIDFLQRRGAVEISEHELDEGMQNFDTSFNIAQLEKMKSTAVQARTLISPYSTAKASLIDSFMPPGEIELGEFIERSKESDEILSRCYDIIDINKRLNEAKAETVRLKTSSESLKVWEELDIPLKNKPTKYTVFLIGTFPDMQSEESIMTSLAEKAPDLDAYNVEIVDQSEVQTCVSVLCLKDDREKMLEALRSIGFVLPNDLPDKTARQVLSENEKRTKKLEEDIEKLTEELKSYGNEGEKIDFLIDCLDMRIDKYEALKNISTTDKVFYLTGYVPEKYCKRVTDKLESKFDVAISVTEPGEDEDVPVLLENNAFGAPVEGITEMYSLPGKHDIDPNAIMAFFYYVFFGMMFSDAGYGLLMVIATAIVLIKSKPEGNKRKTVLMYFYCGISTMFWGIMFGSFFGDAINIIRTNYLGLKEMRLHVWLNPQGDDLMITMIYCFLFGIIHLFVGVGIKGYMEWREGDKLGAVCDTLSIYMAVGGAAPICAGMIIDIPDGVKNIAKYIALAGVILIILTAGRASKGIFGKLGAGLYALYNTVSGYLSDILSYSRLLALGLVTGIIGSVVNMMGTLPKNMVVKTILFVIVFIFGHVVNFGINIIGAYVHTNRLQYVEFFSRFYEGGGNAFKPLKVNSKTFKFKEEINNG